jgi:hypothetical protein
MNKIQNGFTVIVVALALLVACSPRKKEEKQADAVLSVIEQMIAAENYDSAKVKIADFHAEFRHLVEKRKTAVALQDTIIRRESTIIIAYCDSILPSKELLLDSIQKNFIFEKNDAYQDVGNFVHKNQRTETNALRSYLKFYVDENSILYLTSNYTGAKIQHNKIRVTSGDMFVETDTVGYFYAYNDGESNFENLTFNNKTISNIAVFVTDNATKNIKVTLTGDKPITYTLSEADKKAISDTYKFWLVKSETEKLTKENRQAKMKIEKVNALYN